MNLTQSQTHKLEVLTDLREQHSATAAYLKQDYERRKWEAKDTIRSAIADALDAGIPEKRIHEALGFKQINQLRVFLQPPISIGLKDILTKGSNTPAAATPPELTKRKAKVIEDEVGHRTYIREDGTEWRFNMLETFGRLSDRKPPEGEIWTDTIEWEIYQLLPNWSVTCARQTGVDWSERVPKGEKYPYRDESGKAVY